MDSFEYAICMEIILFYSILLLYFVLLKLSYYTGCENEFKYEERMLKFAGVQLIFFAVFVVLLVSLLGTAISYNTIFLITFVNAPFLPFYYIVYNKKDTPYKKYWIEKDKLRKQHFEIINNNVLLNEIKEKEKKLEQEFI